MLESGIIVRRVSEAKLLLHYVVVLQFSLLGVHSNAFLRCSSKQLPVGNVGTKGCSTEVWNLVREPVPKEVDGVQADESFLYQKVGDCLCDSVSERSSKHFDFDLHAIPHLYNRLHHQQQTFRKKEQQHYRYYKRIFYFDLRLLLNPLLQLDLRPQLQQF
jgi:hypothetical protein